MSEGKRKSNGRDKGRRRFRSDGTPIWGQRSIDGPGVWATCIKGKEKQAVGELYDLFESIASELWPNVSQNAPDADELDDSDDDADADEDIEKMVAKEVASIKRPRKEQRFANCQTNTPCVVFISCKPPVDPVQLVLKHIKDVEESGVARTRYTLRLTPVSATCSANLPEIQSLFSRILDPVFNDDPEKVYRYKIELRMRNHSTLSRTTLIQELPKLVPARHKVDLEDPELFILIEIFKSVCGISVVRDYYNLYKFNAMELVNARNEHKQEEGRVGEKAEPRQAENPEEG